MDLYREGEREVGWVTGFVILLSLSVFQILLNLRTVSQARGKTVERIEVRVSNIRFVC